MTVEAAIGRSLAICLHPGLAWRRVRPAARVGIVLAYFSASYVAALAALLAWH